MDPKTNLGAGFWRPGEPEGRKVRISAVCKDPDTTSLADSLGNLPVESLRVLARLKPCNIMLPSQPHLRNPRDPGVHKGRDREGKALPSLL